MDNNMTENENYKKMYNDLSSKYCTLKLQENFAKNNISNLRKKLEELTDKNLNLSNELDKYKKVEKENRLSADVIENFKKTIDNYKECVANYEKASAVSLETINKLKTENEKLKNEYNLLKIYVDNMPTCDNCEFVEWVNSYENFIGFIANTIGMHDYTLIRYILERFSKDVPDYKLFEEMNHTFDKQDLKKKDSEDKESSND